MKKIQEGNNIKYYTSTVKDYRFSDTTMLNFNTKNKVNNKTVIDVDLSKTVKKYT